MMQHVYGGDLGLVGPDAALVYLDDRLLQVLEHLVLAAAPRLARHRVLDDVLYFLRLHLLLGDPRL